MQLSNLADVMDPIYVGSQTLRDMGLRMVESSSDFYTHKSRRIPTLSQRAGKNNCGIHDPNKHEMQARFWSENIRSLRDTVKVCIQ